MSIPLRRIAALTALSSTLLCGIAHAAEGGGCNANEAKNDPAACRREAGAAKAEASKGNLTSPGTAAGANTADRCKALSGSERQDCMSRAAGRSTSSSGSVEGGGIVRETVTTVPAK